jgi:hypothetical protein
MRPQDKAKQLHDNAYRILYLEGNSPLVSNLSKNVARSTVNEFISYHEQEWVGNYGTHPMLIYWEEVLYHLENLE